MFAFRLTWQPIKRGKVGDAPRYLICLFSFFSLSLQKAIANRVLHPLPIDDNRSHVSLTIPSSCLFLCLFLFSLTKKKRDWKASRSVFCFWRIVVIFALLHGSGYIYSVFLFTWELRTTILTRILQIKKQNGTKQNKIKIRFPFWSA